MNQYLIPANSKKSQLLLGFLTYLDAAIFGTGILTTVVLLVIFKNASFAVLIICLIPLLVTAFLVLPIQYYHNMLQLITNILGFYNSRRHYYWKGWCVKDEYEIK